ncbi:MAG: response regulator [Desulfobacteraceae bacterium]|nr:response regulator [Desulfobacteraceae bacterium]
MVANIMIIDDQPYLKELISNDLFLAGHHVFCVENAEDAMENFRLRNIDIVLLDLYLHGYERWDLLHRLKRQDPHRPVLIVTIHEDLVDDPRLAEANGCVIKDIDAHMVIKQIEKILGFQEENKKRSKSPKKAIP